MVTAASKTIKHPAFPSVKTKRETAGCFPPAAIKLQ